MEPHSDTAVFVNTLGYNLVRCPPKLQGYVATEWHTLAERMLTMRVLADRFTTNCNDLVSAARLLKSQAVDNYFPGLPYDQFANWGPGDEIYTLTKSREGNLIAEPFPISAERLIREVESDWCSLLHAIASVEDLICNIAVDLSLRGVAWLHCAEKSNGIVPNAPMGRRSKCRPVLEIAFVSDGHIITWLEWLGIHRNEFTHGSYPYACVIKDAGEVVFTKRTPDHEHSDHADPNTLTHRKLLECGRFIHGEYLRWFMQASEAQIS
jgi:hypothetical protein